MKFVTTMMSVLGRSTEQRFNRSQTPSERPTKSNPGSSEPLVFLRSHLVSTTRFSSLLGDIAGLKQALFVLVELLKQTGVGALPLIPTSLSGAETQLPTEEKLMADLQKSIEDEYAKHTRVQESAGVVANLLTASELGRGRT